MTRAIRLLVALATNMLALWVANQLFAGVWIFGWTAYLVAGAALGLANAILRPLLALLTLPFVIVTLGLFMLVIDVLMLVFAAWVTPHFSIHGGRAYLGTVVVVWVVNWVAKRLVDRTPLRKRGWRQLLKDV